MTLEELEARIPRGKVRTRFAPSPTGYMHVGNLRTALYTWLIARHSGGTFILRIEDTDQNRLVEGATEVIYRTLKECGLDHDEGPDIGGPVGPYIQSERRELYGVDKGAAYRCFCEKCASGDFDREDDPCRTLSRAESDAKADAGEPFVVRQKIPREGSTTFHDVSFGDITVENREMDDQVLLKRDGLPTYNFANVVDDHLMGITHVVRGSEYLASAPKYNLLYEAFGWEIPEYVHCSPVMRDAHNKMSKRHGDPSYEDLIAQGYLTPAVLNYVALLGWSPRGELAEKEFFTLSELSDIPEKVDFFDALPDYDTALFTNKKSKTNPDVSKTMLEAAIPALEAVHDWTLDAIHDTLFPLAGALGVKNATLLWPVRIAVSGRAVTPGGAVELCHILGKEETLRRLKAGLTKL